MAGTSPIASQTRIRIQIANQIFYHLGLGYGGLMH